MRPGCTDGARLADRRNGLLSAVMTQSGTTAPGWYPDPYGRHELRWYDGGQWTDAVASHGRQASDPPTGAVVPAAGYGAAKVQKNVGKAKAAGEAGW